MKLWKSRKATIAIVKAKTTLKMPSAGITVSIVVIITQVIAIIASPTIKPLFSINKATETGVLCGAIITRQVLMITKIVGCPVLEGAPGFRREDEFFLRSLWLIVRLEDKL
jgi:hypothetical protein